MLLIVNALTLCLLCLLVLVWFNAESTHVTAFRILTKNYFPSFLYSPEIFIIAPINNKKIPANK